MSTKPQPLEIKVVLVGAVGVGKTSCIIRYVTDNFKEYLETTIGASYLQKNTLNKKYDQVIKFSIWDTAGLYNQIFVK